MLWPPEITHAGRLRCYLFIQNENVAMGATWWGGAGVRRDDVTPGHIIPCRTCMTCWVCVCVRYLVEPLAVP